MLAFEQFYTRSLLEISLWPQFFHRLVLKFQIDFSTEGQTKDCSVSFELDQPVSDVMSLKVHLEFLLQYFFFLPVDVTHLGLNAYLIYSRH